MPARTVGMQPSTQSQKARVPAGSGDTGGRFAPTSHAESDIVLNNALYSPPPEPEPEYLPDGWVERKFPTGERESRARYVDGVCEDGPNGEPGITMFHRNGQVAIVEYQTCGELHDPLNGAPAHREFSKDGLPVMSAHYQAGALTDPPDGMPAVMYWRDDGSLEHIERYRGGLVNDGPDDAAAMQWFDRDGDVVSEHHFVLGERDTGLRLVG